MSEIIDVNLIKYKAKQYFITQKEGVRLVDAFMKIKIAKTEPPATLILLKRIYGAIRKEAQIIDMAMAELRESHKVDIDGKRELPLNDEQAMREFNDKVNELLETEIAIPFAKIKYSQTSGLESVAELDALEGILEIDEV